MIAPLPPVKAAQAIGVAARALKMPPVQEVHLQHRARVRGQLKLRRGQAGGRQQARELVIREKEIEDRRRIQRRLRQARADAADPWCSCCQVL